MPRTPLYYVALDLWLAGCTYRQIATAMGMKHRQQVQQFFQPSHTERLKIRGEVNAKCEHCSVKVMSGHIHHKTRTAPPNRRENLQYLCRTCHRIAHNLLEAKGI